MDSEDFIKTGCRSREIRVAFGLFLVLFADITDTWRSAIGSFFFLNQTKKIKKI